MTRPASELAEEITEYLQDMEPRELQPLREKIAKALTAFADARGKDWEHKYAVLINELAASNQRYETTRAEALEEAAQTVNSYMYEKGLSVSLIDLAEAIRALKPKP